MIKLLVDHVHVWVSANTFVRRQGETTVHWSILKD